MGVAKGMTVLARAYYEGLSEEYRKKRNNICQALDRVGLTPNIPQGAYYVLADITRLPGVNSKERAMYLLEKTGVACVPGDAFYHDDAGEGLARFCFAKEDAVLDEACHRLECLKNVG
jgi:aminotransferase